MYNLYGITAGQLESLRAAPNTEPAVTGQAAELLRASDRDELTGYRNGKKREIVRLLTPCEILITP